MIDFICQEYLFYTAKIYFFEKNKIFYAVTIQSASPGALQVTAIHFSIQNANLYDCVLLNTN